MSASDDAADVRALDDATLVAALARGNHWLRAVLCTLARRGTRLRRSEPERTATLLGTLAPWPWFKGGQFLFDLMEWEDFMTDGPPPPVLPTVLDAEAWDRLVHRLRDLQGLLEGASGSLDDTARDVLDGLRTNLPSEDARLPPLEPGMHLYRDVVLGVLVSAGPVLRARGAAQDPHDPP